METYTLIPNIPNPIVECHNLELPIPINPIFRHNPGYDTPDNYKRLVSDVPENAHEYFNTLVYDKILPLVFKHERFFWSWPINMETFKQTTEVTTTLVKDEIGWQQGKHEDPRIFTLTGVLHLQDCEQGTHFTDSGYTAPTKKFSGAFWVNSQNSYHLVNKVTSERMAYMVIAKWKFLPGNYTQV